MKFKFLLFLIFALSITVSGQAPDKILKQAEKALGGKKSLQNLTSWQKTGEITLLKTSSKGSILMQASKPNLYHESFDLEGFETESGFNEKSSWTRDSREGLRTLTGAESQDFQAETSYRNNLWLNYKKEKAKITSGGQIQINGKSANLIKLVNAKGVLINIYFDAETFLPIREEIPAGETTKVFDYSDYRLVNGIREPFLIKAKIGEDIFKIELQKIIHNPVIAQNNFDFPRVLGTPLPDIPVLLKELQTNEDKVEAILENYSYTQKITKRELGKDGILRETESETNQLSFYKGYRISRLIENNGRTLNEKDQADEDKEVQKRVAEIEKKIAKEEARAVSQTSNGTPDGDGRRISIGELLRASYLINPRRERLKGRDVIVFDFEPNPDFEYKNAKSFLKFFGKTGGVVWVDEKDKQVARIEAILFDSYKIGGGLVANLKKGASFILEQERVNNEIWLPSTTDINLSVKVFLIKGIIVNQSIKSSNYRKFTTEIKDAKVDEVKNP